jgi:hypothetical protein
MHNLNTQKYITTAATTTFSGNEVQKTVIHGIAINKTLTGTLTIKQGATTIGVIAATTIPGMYWLSENGIYVDNLSIVNGSTEDVTVFYTNI